MKKIIILLIFSILISLSANAQFCNKYADKAVAQYKLAKSNNVPNTNWPMWSDDWNGHFNWCKTVTEDVANKQTAFREAYLNKYITKKEPQTKEDFCNAFADKAVAQYYQAKQLFNLEGDLWSNDRNIHYNWCMQVPKNTAIQQEKIRQAEISEHYGATMNKPPSQNTDSKGEKKDPQIVVTIDSQNSINTDMVNTMLKKNTCEHYAEESVKQNKQNISQACGLSKEPEWSSDYMKHYDWCMVGNNYKTADNNLKTRKKQLTKCSQSIVDVMTKIRGKSAFGTTMATTYMDMHNMFVPHKNNCSSSEAFVPLWQGAELGFCIDKDLYTNPKYIKDFYSISWEDAVSYCMSKNKRLPEIWELKMACHYAKSLGIYRLEQSKEWASNFPIYLETTYKGDASDPGPFSITGMAVPVFGAIDCNNIFMGFVGGFNDGSDKSYRNKHLFRCVH